MNYRIRRYSSWGAYAQSTLANLLFVSELARRGVRAYAADPGTADTDITRDSTELLHWLGDHEVVTFHLQSPQDGARATIEAVTTPLPSGSYLAPRFNQWGRPRVTAIRAKGRDATVARRLWELSAELTGCDWTPRRAQKAGVR